MRAILPCVVLLWASVAVAQPIGPSSSTTGSVTPSGTFTAGDLIVGGPGATQVQDSSAFSGPAVAPKGVNLTGNPVVATSISASTSELYWSGTYSGTCTSVPGCFANSFIMTDTVDGSVSSNGIGNLQVQTTLNSSSIKGGIANFQSNMTVAARTGNAANAFYVSANLWANGAANDGGGSGTERGSLFAVNPQAVLRTAATFWLENSVDEHDFSIDANSSAKYGYIYKAIVLSDNATAPTSDSAAYTAGLQAGGVRTLSCMLCTGANGSASPLSATADFIGHHGGGTAPSIANGINFSNFTLSTTALTGPNSQDLVIQVGTTGSARNLVINSGANGAAFVVGGALASITGRLTVTPGTGVTGASALSNGGSGTGGITVNALATIGGASPATGATGELAFTKIAATGTAPAAGFLKIEAVAGTNAGTCKIIAYAGTSTTPVSIVDNVGTGC